jgi:predicted metalloprotease
MKRTLSICLLVLLLTLPSIGASAQDVPMPVPESTAEMANVGEQGPQILAGGQAYSMDQFVSIVMQDTTVMWANLFESWGEAFVPPTFVTIDAGGYARSSCGINAGDPLESPNLSPALYCQYGGELGTQSLASSDVVENEFSYSPVLYVSLPWLEAYARSSGAAPEIAVSYRLVHEYSYHVEYLLGYIDHTGGGCCDYSDEQVELWAECLTGVWAFSAYDRGQLRSADVEAAQVAAWGEGAILPEQFGRDSMYGTQQQRTSSFMTGYESGSASSCFADAGTG